MEWWLGYIALGILVGFIAGLFGVGGGLTTVPLLALFFKAQNFSPDYLLHMALGTSMACIIFTSISSLYAHHKHGAVDWRIVKVITPGIALGAILGTLLAGTLPTLALALIFTIFTYYAATAMLLDIKPKPTRQIPENWAIRIMGGTIGVISTLLAAGGGFIFIPIMTMCNMKFHKAIGTSAAIGLPIAVAGTIGYIYIGLKSNQLLNPLPNGSIGFIYLPALLGIIISTMIMAPVGAKLAHKLPVAKLRKLFAVMLYILATKMLVSLW